MKREFLISRLDEPNIAHTYVCESDQNLLNNIRILCTRQPETLRYFVPEELFCRICSTTFAFCAPDSRRL